MKDYSSNITRALRKHYSITQKDFCDLIKVSQGTLSKIEAGLLSLSATQWVYMCDHFKVPPTALLTGKIEALKEDTKIELTSAKKVGTFKIPKQYSTHMGSTVRTVFPILNFINSTLGEQATKDLLKKLEVDPDYFIIQSHPVSLMLVNDIVQAVIDKGILTQRNIADILKASSTSEVHSYLLDQMGKPKKPQAFFKNLTSFIAHHYEINSTYKFNGDDKCLIRVEDNLHLQEMNLSDDFTAFRESFNTIHFQNLSDHFSFEGEIKSIKTDKGWDIAYSA